MKTLAALLLFCVGLSGCGQTGPLYLPESRQPAPELSAPDQTMSTQPESGQAAPEGPLPEESINPNSIQ